MFTGLKRHVVLLSPEPGKHTLAYLCRCVISLITDGHLPMQISFQRALSLELQVHGSRRIKSGAFAKEFKQHLHALGPILLLCINLHRRGPIYFQVVYQVTIILFVNGVLVICYPTATVVNKQMICFTCTAEERHNSSKKCPSF